MKLLTSILLTICSFCASSQLTTNNSSTPAALVQNVLLGSGVTASNITYTGSAQAIGYFDATSTNVGIPTGVILTTGTCLNSTGGGILGGPQGPHGPNNAGGAGVDNNEPGDPQLAILGGTDSYNAAVLEFDFVPLSDTIKFNYVFGSEEYLEFVNGGVNDAFAFFLTGPNPAGGNYNSQNIALVPGTNTPVTIDNVNNIANSAYYRDNGDGSNAPYNNSSYYVQYDGMTKVLQAFAKVECGQTYHIKIAISDIGDGVYDSGVFLEAGSFASPNPVTITNSLSFDGFSNNQTLVEGCADATITINRTDASLADAYPVTISGSATMGTDFSNIPNSISFAAGQTTQTINVSAFLDAINESTETIQIDIDVPSNCGNTSTETILLDIHNVEPLNIDLPDVDIVCPNDPAVLTPNISGGFPHYNYLWSTGETSSSITVNPSSNTTYTLTVTDTCGTTEVHNVNVNLIPYIPMTVDAGNDITVQCPSEISTLTGTVIDGAGPFSYSWSTGDTILSTNVSPLISSNYVLTVTDLCGNTVSDDVFVTVVLQPLQIALTPDTVICPGDSIALVATAFLGKGPDYDYLWDNGSTDSIIWVKPTGTISHTVVVTDGCGTYQVDKSVQVSLHYIKALFSVHSTDTEIKKPITFLNQSTGATSYQWDLGNGRTSIDTHPTTTYDPEGMYQVTLVAESQIGCTDTFSLEFEVFPELNFYAPNAFSPNGDGINDVFFGKGTAIKEYEMIIFNRWGELIYQTNDMFGSWDGTYKGNPSPMDVYVYKFKILGQNEKTYEFTGHTTIVK